MVQRATAPEQRARRINIGQIFRVRGTGVHDFESYETVTAGRFDTGADIQKGMFFYADVPEPGQPFRRAPAFIFHSNPLKSGTEWNPWIDVVEPDVGYALFHGDNRRGGRGPLESRGNAKFASVQQLYTDPALRRFAPPVLLFTQTEVKGNRKGYRQFSGYGVPVRWMIGSQREKQSSAYFTNLVLEITLFRLDRENEAFDWAWIDARRDGAINADEVLRRAPCAWRTWVEGGEAVLQKCQRWVARSTVVSENEQRHLSSVEADLLARLTRFYSDKKHAFEGLASYVAAGIIGSNCKRAWVTKRSADGGIDFVCRLHVGTPGDFLGRAAVVLLGQAKCLSIKASVSGLDLARLVARLQRGWLGVFVTTGVFSRAAQAEIQDDKYPVLLINGQQIVRFLQRVMVIERISLDELLQRESAWYEANIKPLPAARVLDDSLFGTDMPTSWERVPLVDRIASSA